MIDYSTRPDTIHDKIEQPHPLDRALIGGVAIRAESIESQLDAVAERLQFAFDAIRSDTTNERGEVIALAVPQLPTDLADFVDEFVLDIAKRQNHGLQTLQLEDQAAVDRLWTGRDPETNRYLRLYKNTATIVMSDSSAPIGDVWVLKGRTLFNSTS